MSEDKAAPVFITNKTGPGGVVLCPACNRGAVWDGVDKNGKPARLTSPMRKLSVPGKINALFHTCCIAAIMRKIVAQAQAEAKVKAPAQTPAPQAKL